MRWLAHLLPSRLTTAMLAAAVVFLLAGATLGDQGISFAQGVAPTPPGQEAPTDAGSPPQGDLQTTGAQAGTRRSCSDIPESRDGFFLGKIVPCLLKTIQSSASRMSREMIDVFRPLLMAFITFVMVIFGVQILQNEGQLQARAFTLLLKIGFCFAILAAIPGNAQTGEGGLIGTAYGIMEESQAVVMGTIGPESGDVYCQFERYGGANTPLIWKHMDCLLGKLYGFTVGTPTASGKPRPNMVLASSILGMLGGFFFSSTVGVTLFFFALGVLISMFTLVLKILVTYINSYMFIALYMILAPLLLPLMFLRVTNSIFEKWYSGILMALLMPVVISSYVVLALQVYDKAFFSETALINQLYNNEFIRQAQQNPRPACDRSITNDPQFRVDATGRTREQLYTGSPFLTNFVNPLLSGANNICGGISVTSLNLQNMPSSKGPLSGQQALASLFRQCVELVVLTFLMTMGFKKILDILRTFPGAGAVVGALDKGTKQEQQFKNALSQARQGFERDIRSPTTGAATSGTEFLQRIAPAMGGAGRGFLTGMGVPVSSGSSGASRGGAAGAGGAAGGTAGGGAQGGAASGGSGGGDDDGPSGSGGNSGGSNAGGGQRGAAPGGGAPGSAAPRSVRDLSAPERAAAARDAVPDVADRFEELDRMFERGELPADRREEYENLIARIDEAMRRGG